MNKYVFFYIKYIFPAVEYLYHPDNVLEKSEVVALVTCGGGSVVVTRTVVGAIFECHQINLPKENLKQACLFHGNNDIVYA